MMRSMFSGISGLKVHQTKMDVIANNIANVNTIGYKSQRATFNEYMSQNLSGASRPSPNAGRGGTNPKQVGLGVTLGSIDVNMNAGAAQRTDRPLDLMLNGDGFFIVGDSSGQYFTRDGNFSIDAQGNVVNSSGMQVMGWDVREETDPVTGKPTGKYIPNQDKVQPLSINGDKTYSPPSATENIKFAGNLNSDENPEHNSTITFFDSVGNRWTQDTKMVWDETNQQWDVQMSNVAYLNGDPSQGYEVDLSGSADPDWSASIVGPVSDNPAFVETFNTVSSDLKFDSQGIFDASSFGGSMPTYSVTAPAGSIKQNADFGNETDGKMTFDFNNLTMFGNEAANASSDSDGNYPGQLNNISVTPDGGIYGSYSNGETRLIAALPIATFANPAGLEKVGGNMFAATANSGEFDGIGVGAASIGSAMFGGALEMSNVDLSSEFTEMITTQRGFQAASRIITTSDELLQELVNLKR